MGITMTGAGRSEQSSLAMSGITRFFPGVSALASVSLEFFSGRRTAGASENGAGSILGIVIAAFVMGFVLFGLGLLNVPGFAAPIFVSALLFGVIALARPREPQFR